MSGLENITNNLLIAQKKTVANNNQAVQPHQT
jgi:hypothetical protein